MKKWFKKQTPEDIDELIRVCNTVLENNPEAWVQRKFKFRKKELLKKKEKIQNDKE